MNLAARLVDIRRRFEASDVAPEVFATLEAHVDRLVRDDVAKRALAVGAQAPEAWLDGLEKERGTFELTRALQDGPVVLTWFRGSW